VHFTRSMDPRWIGHKALACNISDIAAMGGIPTFAVVSVGLPANLSVSFVKKIYEGINHLAKEFKVGIVGGDTNRASQIVINLALLGKARKNQVVYRKGAKKGDWIFTTGGLGGSFKSGKHLSFLPRLKESRYLVQNFHPNSMIDIFDGLAADLWHILKESKVGAAIYEDRIPKNKKASLRQALYEGEDFELLFTLKPTNAKKLLRLKPKGLHFYCLGEIIKQPYALYLVGRDGRRRKLKAFGFRHF